MSAAPQAEADRQDSIQRKRRVLGALSLIVILILTIPALLYSITPTGPIREGDVVYANARHEVRLFQSVGDACFLERRDALLVVQKPSDRSDGLLLSRVQDRSRHEPPFCAPRAEVLVSPHQILQTISLWDDLRTVFVRR